MLMTIMSRIVDLTVHGSSAIGEDESKDMLKKDFAHESELS